jgi:hypothetical protein
VTTQPHLQAVPADRQGENTPHTNANPNFVISSPPLNPPGDQPPTGRGSNRSGSKPRSEHPLPSDRLTFDKQRDVLLAIAQMGGSVKRAVTAEECSAAVGLKGGTGGLSNRFFCDAGWVDFAGRGNYAPSDALVEYYRQTSIDPTSEMTAREHLRATMKSAWFWGVLEPLLGPGGLRRNLAVMQLSKAAGTTDHTPQLHLILEWVEWVGLVRREGDLLHATVAASDVATNEDQEDATPDVTPTSAPDAASAAAVVQDDDPAPAALRPATDAPIDESLVSFSFNVRITADDAAKLSGEQLATILAFAEKLRG